MEVDDEIKLREKFQISCLMMGEDFGGQKIL